MTIEAPSPRTIRARQLVWEIDRAKRIISELKEASSTVALLALPAFRPGEVSASEYGDRGRARSEALRVARDELRRHPLYVEQKAIIDRAHAELLALR